MPVIGDVMAVVLATCDFSHSRELVFSTKWQQSYIYQAGNYRTPSIQLVDPNAIMRHCLMVPHEDSHYGIWSQELWSNGFNDCS
jgi:hypothetical protein